MKKIREMGRLVLVFVIYLSLINLTTGEIHRANALKNKLGRSANRDHQGRNHLHNHHYNHRHGPFFFGHSKETWIYSFISAALVGLSGIFPLAVIPLETGQALRKGGEALHEATEGALCFPGISTMTAFLPNLRFEVPT